jgi:SPP1 family predicted phage head-tail adaptor
MEAGKLNTPAIVQARTLARDAEGNQAETWHDIMTVWLEPLEQTSREFYRLSTVNSEIEQAFRGRYNASINSKMRLKIGYRYFNIIGAEDEGGRHRSLLYSCKAVN